MKTKLLALSLGLAVAFAPVAYASSDTRLFDAAVAGGLPTDVTLPSADGGTRLIRVLEKVDAGVDTGAGADGAIYLIEVNGVQGTLLRLGDDLDVALDDAPPRTAARAPHASLHR